jgi:hypothetical protein
MWGGSNVLLCTAPAHRDKVPIKLNRIKCTFDHNRLDKKLVTRSEVIAGSLVNLYIQKLLIYSAIHPIICLFFQ